MFVECTWCEALHTSIASLRCYTYTVIRCVCLCWTCIFFYICTLPIYIDAHTQTHKHTNTQTSAVHLYGIRARTFGQFVRLCDAYEFEYCFYIHVVSGYFAFYDQISLCQCLSRALQWRWAKIMNHSLRRFVPSWTLLLWQVPRHIQQKQKPTFPTKWTTIDNIR